MGKWTNIKTLKREIAQLRLEGISRGEICEKLKITIKQLENHISRCNREEKEIANGKMPKAQGRPRKTEENIEAEVKRLRMENELLRDFLWESGRGSRLE